MTAFEVLARYPLFQLPPAPLLHEWLRRGQIVRIPMGETLFQEGSPGAWAYVLLEGRVRVLRRNESGAEVTQGSLQPGQLFGEYALLKPNLNTATCRAAGDSVVAQIPLASIRHWLDQTPAVARLKNWLQLHQLLQHVRGQSHRGFMSDASALAMKPHLLPLEVGPMRTLQTYGLCEDWWFAIEAGEVQIGAEPGGIQYLGPGDCFGSQALLGNKDVPVAVSLTATRLMALPRPFFVRPQQVSGKSAEQSYSADRLEHPSRVRWIGQREPTDCGPASLAMLAHYYELSFDLDEIRTRVVPGPRGLTALELLQAAHDFSLHGEAIRIQPNQLPYIQTPAIVHLDRGHFAVLFRLDPQGVLLGDPASGLVSVSFAHFVERSSGCLLLLRPVKS